MSHKIGWVGAGRMGYPMASRLAKDGQDVSVWNRTKSKADPLSEYGANVVSALDELHDVDVLFTMVSTGKDLKQVYFGDDGVLSKGSNKSQIFVDCSSISSEDSNEIRERLNEKGVSYISCPVSGNGKAVKAGVLSIVASGPEDIFNTVKPYLETIAPRGVAYVGDGDLARFCKIAHNVMLGVVIQNLAEITILAQKAGVPRHAFLNFMNNSVMGSIFTQYKSNAFTNLDWTTTFTTPLLLKDLDLGLQSAKELGVPMPVTAATRQVVQQHAGRVEKISKDNLEKKDDNKTARNTNRRKPRNDKIDSPADKPKQTAKVAENQAKEKESPREINKPIKKPTARKPSKIDKKDSSSQTQLTKQDKPSEEKAKKPVKKPVKKTAEKKIEKASEENTEKVTSKDIDQVPTEVKKAKDWGRASNDPRNKS